MSHNRKLYILACYAPIGQSSDFGYEFNQIFSLLKLDDISNFYILADDLNARHSSWENPMNNNRGTLLNRFIEENEIDIGFRFYHSSTPSYSRGNSLIDLCFADARINVETLPNINFDNKIPVLPY